MKVQKTIVKETARIAIGTAVLTLLMLLVYLLIGKFGLPCILGALIGFVAAVLDFFLLGLSVQSAAEYQAAHPIKEETPMPVIGDEDKQEQPEDEPLTGENKGEKHEFADPETAKTIKARMQRSYMLRRILLVGFAALGLINGIDLIAVVVPMLFPKIVIFAVNIIENKKKGGIVT